MSVGVAAPTTMSIFFFSLESSCTASATDDVVSSMIMSTLLGVIPAPGDGGAEVRLVLVVGGDDLDLVAEHLPPKSSTAMWAASSDYLPPIVGIDAGLVVEDADLDALRRSRRGKSHAAGDDGNRNYSRFHSSNSQPFLFPGNASAR